MRNLIIFGSLVCLCSFLIFITQSKIDTGTVFKSSGRLLQNSNAFHFETVDLAEVLQLKKNPNIVIIDVRQSDFFDYGHIQGSINIPLEAIADSSIVLINNLKKKSAVILYCNGISCGRGYEAVLALMKRGVTNAKIYPGGWPEWKSCGLPVSVSKA